MKNTVSVITNLSSQNATPIPTAVQARRGSGAYSLNIVCAKNNRKSITLTKKLAEQLQLTSDVYVTVYASDGCIVLSGSEITKDSALYSFSNNKDHIIYNAALVYFLADTFGLDYTERTSMAFRDIQFDTIQGIAAAIVFLKAQTGNVSPHAPITEEEASDDSNVDDCP